MSKICGGMHYVNDAAQERSPETELEHRDARRVADMCSGVQVVWG